MAESPYTLEQEKALDYTIRVFKCQNRILDFETMYSCYKSMHFKNQLTKEEYLEIYNDTVRAIEQCLEN